MKELDEIKQRIAEGKTKISISQFRDFIESKSFDKRVETRAYYDKVILVSGRYSAIENEIRLGIIRKEDELVERNRINNDLLQLVNQFPKVSDNTPVPGGESITKRVKNISDQNEFKYDVFLSFSSKDREAAIQLYESLVGYGLQVFISSEYFKKNIGASFQREIEYALKHSRSFLLYWTDNARQSKWVEIEYMAFFQEFYMKEGSDRKFYIFRPETSSHVELPLFLRQIQFTSHSRELIFSIIEKEEARIKAAQDKQGLKEKAKLEAEQELKRRESAAKLKAEAEKKQQEEAAKAKAEKERKQQEAVAKAKKEQEKKEAEKLAKKTEEEKRNKNSEKGEKMEDIYDQFGSIFGGEPKKEKKSNQGKNLRVTLLLSKSELKNGVQKKIRVKKDVACDACQGSGAKDKNSIVTCSTCTGEGHVKVAKKTFLGQTMTTTTCPTCGGTGNIIKIKCSSCKGSGIEKGEEIFKIQIPSNTQNGQQFRLAGKGNCGPNQTKNGDLHIIAKEKNT